MEIYENEHDQVNAVKRFFAENGKALVVGVVLGVGALVGWRFWSNYQDESVREVSLAYDNAITSIQADKPETLVPAEKFVADNKNIYGVFASLELAQQYVEANQLDKAAELLGQALAEAKDDNIKAIVSLRLARVQIQSKQADAALASLDALKSESWAMVAADLRGEALLSKGDKQGALEAWRKGAELNTMPALSEIMQMKINNLSV